MLFTDAKWFTSPLDRDAANLTHPLSVITILDVLTDLRPYQLHRASAEAGVGEGEDHLHYNNFTIFVVPKNIGSRIFEVASTSAAFTPYFLKELQCDVWSGKVYLHTI